MKALVLAAGLGTRLRPWTQRIPKPLFPVGGVSMLERLIDQLAAAGCEAVAVNTHHLAPAIHAALAARRWRIPVRIRHEERILGTGGAIANLADFWDRRPFLVVNGDIVTAVDFAAVHRFHTGHADPVTLVVTDHGALNSVVVAPEGYIARLRPGTAEVSAARTTGRLLTFTGIQVLDPLVLDFLPRSGFAESINAYEALQEAGYRLRALRSNAAWTDAGTPERYRRAAADALIPKAFQREMDPAVVNWEPLAGDGSDRHWFRLRAGKATVVLADHGISVGRQPGEVDAVIAIGQHLNRRNVPVPAIRAAEPFAGLVAMADFGDTRLQSVVRRSSPLARRDLYRRVMEELIHMSHAGARGFDSAWCHQGARYDRRTIVEREGLYFLDAYVRSVAAVTVDDDTLMPAFEHVARCIERVEPVGFMHRDFQSRNIMVDGERIGIIDYQGGRIGPLAYDLASLLIDPYVDLPPDLQTALLADAVAALGLSGRRVAEFISGYRYCALARNLQILGAFGFLWRARGKTGFADYIPAALAGLKRRLAEMNDPQLAPLQELVQRL
jgi:aminoglycoside/choline kinase family phosphotransferase/GTP:adenosylcobinamide-phosphate guanylyltransferase